jgi:hypothetical protein
MRRRIPTNEVLATPEAKAKPNEPTKPESKPKGTPDNVQAEMSNVMQSMTDDEGHGGALSGGALQTDCFRGKIDVPETPPRPAPPRRHVSDATQRGFASIVAFVYSIDLGSDFDRIKGQLRLDKPPSQSDYGTLVNALDEASENARLALQVLAVAKSVHDGMVSNAEVVTAPLYAAAKAKLQTDKDAGKVSKQITNGDVEQMAARMYPSELNAQAEQASQAKRTIEYLEGLAQRWGERCRDLRQMVAGARNV